MMWAVRSLVTLAMRIVGVLVGLLGAVWLLQGLSVLPGTFMVGSAFWTFAGLALLVCGGAFVYLAAKIGR